MPDRPLQHLSALESTTCGPVRNSVAQNPPSNSNVPQIDSLQRLADLRSAIVSGIVSDLLMLLDHSYEGSRCQVPCSSRDRCAHLHCCRRVAAAAFTLSMTPALVCKRPQSNTVSSWRLPVRVVVNSGHDQLLFVPVSENWSPHNVGAP